MKRLIISALAIALVLGMSLNVMAMSHGDHSGHDNKHGDHSGHDNKHGDHDMSGDDFVEIGKDSQKGVVATVKVKTYDDETRETMAKMGMDSTHHVMVFFTDEKSGEAVSGGKAAIKVEGQEGKPAMLMQMGDGYGADVKLEGMMNTFEIGTKLGDGEKRQFKIMYHNM